ncbi:MAG: GatB/YqeY domain-containing protein [Chrysiogenales bacterium]|nr:MAG: GatB/YqeY domain-containing protein [Chrysiogenales bacterium]
MSILDKIDTDLKSAMKSGDSIRVETLKMLKSDFSYEKGKTGEDLTGDQIMEIISRAAKRRRESIKEFQKGNRQDLADKEASELAIVEEYLPKQLSAEEIEKHIAGKLAGLGDISQKDFGRVMGEIMKELKGTADGGIVRSILAEKIEKK